MVAKLGKYLVVLTVDDLVALTAAHSDERPVAGSVPSSVEQLDY